MIKRTLSMTACLVISAMSAFADEPTDQSYGQMDEVLVLGEVLLQDQINALKTPDTNHQCASERICNCEGRSKDADLRSIGDIVNHVPGLNTSQGEGHRDSVVFRGVCVHGRLFH